MHGLLLVASFVGLVVAADYAWEGGFGRDYELVRPDGSGDVVVDVADLAPSQVRFYRFLNRGNQEVRFFVGRDRTGELQVAFDASETHAKLGRGFRHEGDWMVDAKCGSACRLDQVNQGGHGCTPIPLAHRVVGHTVVLTEAQILTGWRYFR